jgi:tRNA dimethylallyltransferase
LERQVIIIVGPTCSGKTELSIELAEKLNTEIISCDSRQIYKYLDIGTAKPSPYELQKIKHHFVDKLFPDEFYNASRFEAEALNILKDLSFKGKIPIAAGGSGLYIKALVDGITDAAVDTDYRKYLLDKKEKYGNEYLYNELTKCDPETASKMLPQNWKRVMRALEVIYLTGEPIWKHHKDYKRDDDFYFLQFGLNWPREILYKNIECRVDEMIKRGLVDEVKFILKKGYDKNLNALNTVGYKEIISYLKDEILYNEAVRLIKRNTKHYAKRQMTWFKADTRIKWFNLNSKDDLKTISEKIILSYQKKLYEGKN